MSDLSAYSKPAYTIDEFSKLMNIARSRVWQEIRERHLHAVHAGRQTLIPASEISAWLERLPPAGKAVPVRA